MGAIIAYKFDKDIAKKMGKKKFLKKYSAIFPHLNLEQVWSQLFPLSKSSSKDDKNESGE